MEEAAGTNPLLAGLDLALGGGNNFPVSFWEISCFGSGWQKKVVVYPSFLRAFKN